MDALELEISGPLTALMARGEEIATDEIRRGLEASLVILQSDIVRRHDRGATGALRGGIQTAVRGDRADLQGRVFSTVSYALPVEEGGRPHRAPFAAILAWASRQGGRDPRRLARAVYWSIARKGTKAQPRWKPAFDAKSAAIKARFERVLADLDARLGGMGR